MTSISKRLENNYIKYVAFISYSKIIVNYYSIKFSIIFLTLLFVEFRFFNLTYTGWRHLQKLPLRGQHSKTNNNKKKSINNLLLNHKKALFKSIFNVPNFNMFQSTELIIILECINLLWKTQWYNEWLELRRKKIQYIKKKNNKIKTKIDLTAINLELIALRSKFLQKKTKASTKNSSAILGFETGQSINYFK